MALRRKGTRVITVDGVEYRWVVAPNDEPGMAVVVERRVKPGQRMATWVDHGTVVSPRLVSGLIRDAQARGWRPSQSGRQLTFRI